MHAELSSKYGADRALAVARLAFEDKDWQGASVAAVVAAADAVIATVNVDDVAAHFGTRVRVCGDSVLLSPVMFLSLVLLLWWSAVLP